MAQVVRPFGSAGLGLKVLVGWSGAMVADAIRAGQPVPRPVWADAEIDTGSNTTAIAAAVLRQLGLVQPVGYDVSHTAAGPVRVPL
jgi:hypothetical protein